MIGATIYLVLLIALVTKMVVDVQKSKRVKEQIYRFQVLAGILPHDRKTKKDLSPEITGEFELQRTKAYMVLESLGYKETKLSHEKKAQ